MLDLENYLSMSLIFYLALFYMFIIWWVQPYDVSLSSEVFVLSDVNSNLDRKTTFFL